MKRYCSNDEFLAAYLDKRLSDAERLAFEHHLSVCPDCLAGLLITKADLDEFESIGAGKTVSAPAAWNRPAPAMTPRPERRVPFSGVFDRVRTMRPAPTAILAALCAGVMAASFFLAIASPAWDPYRIAGRADLARILETANIGELRLVNGAPAPYELSLVYRSASPEETALFVDAEKLIRMALARYPQRAELYTLLADLYVAGGQVERAELHFRHALTLSPDNPARLNNLAVSLYRLGRSSEARDALERAVGSGKAPLEAYYNLAILAGEMGDSAAAARHAETYLSMDAHSPWARRLRDLVSVHSAH